MPAGSKLPSYEEIYRNGREHNVAPFDEVISFIFRFKPDRPAQKIKVLEIGCGVGNNLLFLAGLGFDVHGIDNSETAINTARARFADNGLKCDLHEQSFTVLPWMDGTFDMVYDRASLMCADMSTQKRAIREVNRVLKPGGRFMFTPYQTCVNGNTTMTFRDAVRLMPHDQWEIIGAEGVLTTCADDVFGEWREKESHYRIYAQKQSCCDKSA